MARYGRWVGKPGLALVRLAPEREINRVTLFMGAGACDTAVKAERTAARDRSRT